MLATQGKKQSISIRRHERPDPDEIDGMFFQPHDHNSTRSAMRPAATAGQAHLTGISTESTSTSAPLVASSPNTAPAPMPYAVPETASLTAPGSPSRSFTTVSHCRVLQLIVIPLIHMCGRLWWCDLEQTDNPTAFSPQTSPFRPRDDRSTLNRAAATSKAAIDAANMAAEAGAQAEAARQKLSAIIQTSPHTSPGMCKRYDVRFQF